MVTHDVDEAVTLSDRIVMMTNGRRPRLARLFKYHSQGQDNRADLIESEQFLATKQRVLNFLDGHDNH